MEPPAKRRRMSQWLLDKENADQDDDELAFRPFEVKAKRDPDYKLSVERAFADQRFQATMAHIFEKYGRDFEGIGDEIDLETGEIVVNNGHVRNMRDEGDVGDGQGGDLADGEDDEDEGILLEDLFDDEEAYGDEDTGEERRHVGFDKDAQDGNDTDDDEEDRIIQGREASRNSHSTALVLGSSSANALGVPRTVAPSLLYAAHKGTHLGFASPMGLPFGPSPFSFDQSPFVTEPWGFPGHHSDPLWDQPGLFAVHQPQKQQLPVTPSRYNFPARSGESSIWARGSKFRGDEDEPLQSAFTATFGKNLLTRRRKVLRHPLLLPPAKTLEGDENRGEQEEEEDEDAILTGKRSKAKKNSHATSAETTGNSDDSQQSKNATRKGAEERGGEGTSSDSGYKSVESARRGRKRKQRLSDDFTRADTLAKASESKRRFDPQPDKLSHKAKKLDQNASLLELPDETDGRRRSGRMRKQVEFLNKVSWAEALAEQRAEKHNLYLEHEEAEDSPESLPQHEESHILSGPETDCIPDSADEDEEEEGEEERGDSNPQVGLSISSESNVRQPNVADHSSAQGPTGFSQKNIDSGCILSDDEAPTLLSKPRKSIPQTTPTSVLPLREVHNVQAQTRAQASSPDLGKQRSPIHSHRRRMDTKDAFINSSPIKSKRSLGRFDIPSEESTSGARLSSSPTRFLSRITLEASPDDTLQPSETSATKIKKQSAAIPPSSPCARIREDTPKTTTSTQKRRQPTQSAGHTTAVFTVIDDSSYETVDDFSHAESSPLFKSSLRVDQTFPSPRRTASPPKAVNQEITHTPSKASSKSPSKSPSKRDSQLASIAEVDTPLPSLSNPPQTPRRHSRLALKVPSSRHSILSLLSDDEDEEIDELGRNPTAMPKSLSSAGQTTARKVWKSSSRTREVYHTPVKKRPSEPVSPGSIIKTPGGTLRACGLDGYRCGRDFCFTCL
ncbi:hypothetical protein V8C35DRAFT_287298 [Trichoderma chlorosporum]